MIDPRAKTPCIGVCSTGIGDRVCRGCKRFAHEVIQWNSYSNQQKSLINERLAGFLSQCTRNKLRVLDADVLQAQLRQQQIPFAEHQDAYCWAYALLKAGGSQIEQPELFGLQVDAEYRDTPLDALRRMIDEEFYILSEAYYERYIGLGDIA
ncbi:MAG: DUF1289 domain-containing protein [Halieaceae bacterium]|jgi:predicted Fe-S protein YdhL (DUF1289 family)|nr:DUF1289 domain-containing protein [Halieaceae bacterium]